MIRDTFFLWDLSCIDGNKDFLASDCMGTGGVFALLIGSNVGDSHYFPYLSIAGSWFPLAATSKGRKVGDNSPYLRQFVSKTADSGAENKKFGWPAFNDFRVAFAVGKAARDVCGPAGWDFARDCLNSFANDNCKTAFLGIPALARRCHAGIVFFWILNSAGNTVFGF